MTLLIVDVSGLQEMKDDIEHIIHQAEVMNVEAKERINQFHALELDADLKQRILDILFSEATQ